MGVLRVDCLRWLKTEVPLGIGDDEHRARNPVPYVIAQASCQLNSPAGCKLVVNYWHPFRLDFSSESKSTAHRKPYQRWVSRMCGIAAYVWPSYPLVPLANGIDAW
jgi:hypothetical protein